MYDELVKRLREPCQYENCILCQQAADAIEELQEDNAALNGTVSNLIQQIEELNTPRWIPVSERLPKEADGMVFVLMPDVFPYNSKQPFVNCNQDRRVDMAHYSEHSRTWYFGDCGAVGGQEPIAWIHRNALPEPPKEE